MQQYDEIKTQYPDGFLFFQMGDFFEMFGDDAVRASKLLGLTLTARDKQSANPMPFAGVPIHAGERYLAELTRMGHKVVVCEQVSAPQKGGVIERAVTRVVTPGTTLSGSVLEAKAYNVIAAIIEDKGAFAMAWADSSTGAFWVRHCHNIDSLAGLLARTAPKEILLHPHLFSRDAVESLVAEATGISFSYTPSSPAEKVLMEHFGAHALASFGLEQEPLLREAAGMVLSYIIETQKKSPTHCTRVLVEQEADSMHLDWQTIRNLELFSTAREGKREGSLVEVLDRSKTAMGGRYLRQALLFPLTNRTLIEARLIATEALTQKPAFLSSLRQHLGDIHDMERLLGRLSLGRGNARDLLALRDSLEQFSLLLPKLQKEDLPLTSLQSLTTQYAVLVTLQRLLHSSIADEPKPVLNEGQIIRDGYNDELDELRRLQRDARGHLLAYQEKEQTRTGISTLKVKYTGVFGYSLEISKSQLAKVPEDYMRKQSLVGAERFTTPELKELEDRILHADERIVTIEYSIFEEIRQKVMDQLSPLHDLAAFLGELDFLASNAALALEQSYCHPVFTPTRELSIKEGRHPVVETLLKKEGQSFVANDTHLDEKQHLHLITGPNMAGKSTYLRQVALIAHMAHCGMFVPAQSATIPLLDRIFTRIGAQDNLTRGQSTFMVEMQETAHILHYATENSLIILDEIGRGTSTYDGLSIAWAIVEQLHNDTKAHTLFATHYHELIDVAAKLPHAANFSVAVSEQGSGIVFLHAIVPGGAPDSYGIDVAALAGIPREVLEAARQHLTSLEQLSTTKKSKRQADPNQLSFFQAPPPVPAHDPKEDELLRQVRSLDPDRLSPREAHELLYSLRDILQ